MYPLLMLFVLLSPLSDVLLDEWEGGREGGREGGGREGEREDVSPDVHVPSNVELRNNVRLLLNVELRNYVISRQIVI